MLCQFRFVKNENTETQPSYHFIFCRGGEWLSEVEHIKRLSKSDY